MIEHYKISLVKEIIRLFKNNNYFDDYNIDISTPQGSFELLISGVLYAARVKEELAKRTFFQLRENGLLDLERLAKREKKDEEKVVQILVESYRCQFSKKAKKDAIFDNAKRVKYLCDGDLSTIYFKFEKNSKKTFEFLGNFHINAKRSYICREMRLRGPWKDFEGKYCCVPDVHVKRALVKTGLAEFDGERAEDTSDDLTREYIYKYFGDDFDLPMFFLGKYFCSIERHEECPEKIRANCKNVKRHYRRN